MRLHPRCVVVVMLLLVPTIAQANDHVARIAGGYSKLKSSSFDGGQGSLEVALPRTLNRLAIVVDASINFGEDAGTDVTKVTALAGLRGVWRTAKERVVLFAHVLPLGGHRSHIGSDAENDWAWAGGFGGDYVISGVGTGTATHRSGWVVSVQADWVRAAGDTSLRINTGIGFRYK